MLSYAEFAIKSCKRPKICGGVQHYLWRSTTLLVEECNIICGGVQHLWRSKTFVEECNIISGGGQHYLWRSATFVEE